MYYRNWQAVSGPTVPQGDFIGNAIKMATEATGGWQKAQQDNAAGFMAQEAAKYQDPAELQKALASGAITQGIDSRYITPALMKQMDERVVAGQEQQHKSALLGLDRAKLDYFKEKTAQELADKRKVELDNRMNFQLQSAIETGDQTKIDALKANPEFQSWLPTQGKAGGTMFDTAYKQQRSKVINDHAPYVVGSPDPVANYESAKAYVDNIEDPVLKQHAIEAVKARGVDLTSPEVAIAVTEQKAAKTAGDAEAARLAAAVKAGQEQAQLNPNGSTASLSSDAIRATIEAMRNGPEKDAILAKYMAATGKTPTSSVQLPSEAQRAEFLKQYPTASPANYNAYIGNGKYGKLSKNITDMTVRESIDHAREVLKPGTMGKEELGYGGTENFSTALGYGQIVTKTLEKLAPRVLGPDWEKAPMSPVNQERLMEQLYKDVAGNSKRSFAEEWQGLGNTKALGAKAARYRDPNYKPSWAEVREDIIKAESGGKADWKVVTGQAPKDQMPGITEQQYLKNNPSPYKTSVSDTDKETLRRTTDVSNAVQKALTDAGVSANQAGRLQAYVGKEANDPKAAFDEFVKNSDQKALRTMDYDTFKHYYQTMGLANHKGLTMPQFAVALENSIIKGAWSENRRGSPSQTTAVKLGAGAAIANALGINENFMSIDDVALASNIKTISGMKPEMLALDTKQKNETVAKRTEKNDKVDKLRNDINGLIKAVDANVAFLPALQKKKAELAKAEAELAAAMPVLE